MSDESIMPNEMFPGVDLSTELLPREVDAIRAAIKEALVSPDSSRPGSPPIGTAKTGIYAFFDYDGEPIYVGQTAESFATRIGRHMTGMRSDSVAKYVLDPFEVYAIAMWSLPHIYDDYKGVGRKAALNAYEYAVHQRLTEESSFNAVLNEGNIPKPSVVPKLREPVRAVIIPDEIFPDRSHPDIRIARRALTVSLLAKNISERKVSKGLRRTLLTQTRRLVELAERRYEAVGGVVPIDDASDLMDELDE
jgi:hypothetical protein